MIYHTLTLANVVFHGRTLQTLSILWLFETLQAYEETKDVMIEHKSAPLLYEMLRSFTVLAEELNLSRAVKRLGSTRQTVRRHIDTLEEFRGEPLFDLDDRRYILTEAGQRALDEADDIVARGQAWMKNQTARVNRLSHLSSRPPAGFFYQLQQQPLIRVFQDAPTLIRHAMAAWVASGGQIEHPDFQAVRPQVVVFRRFDSNWVCVEVGERSSYSTWFGWEWARSSIGLKSADLPGGRGFGRLLVEPFEEVDRTFGARLDHIVTELPRQPGQSPVPISYQRLLLGCRFPDESRGLVSVVVRTWNIEIEGVTQEEIQRMDADLRMDDNSSR